MLSFSICPTAFFMVRFRWGRDPTLQLYDDSFTELPAKPEFELFIYFSLSAAAPASAHKILAFLP